MTESDKNKPAGASVTKSPDGDAGLSLFGAHRGSVLIRDGVDLIAPALDVEPDAESGLEIER